MWTAIARNERNHLADQLVGAGTYGAVSSSNQLHFHIGAGSIQGSRTCPGIVQWVHGPLQHHARAPIEVLHQVVERSGRRQIED